MGGQFVAIVAALVLYIGDVFLFTLRSEHENTSTSSRCVETSYLLTPALSNLHIPTIPVH